MATFRIKAPCEHLSFSHSALEVIQQEIDNFRDNVSDIINEQQFESLLEPLLLQHPDEKDLVRDLAQEAFLSKIEDDRCKVDEDDHYADDIYLPPYKQVLNKLHDHDMFACYDREIHELCITLANSLGHKRAILRVAEQIALYQLQFDENSSSYLDTIFFVLKTLATNKTCQKYQKAIFRAQTLISQASLL